MPAYRYAASFPIWLENIDVETGNTKRTDGIARANGYITFIDQILFACEGYPPESAARADKEGNLKRWSGISKRIRKQLGESELFPIKITFISPTGNTTWSASIFKFWRDNMFTLATITMNSPWRWRC